MAGATAASARCNDAPSPLCWACWPFVGAEGRDKLCHLRYTLSQTSEKRQGRAAQRVGKGACQPTPVHAGQEVLIEQLVDRISAIKSAGHHQPAKLEGSLKLDRTNNRLVKITNLQQPFS